MAWLKRNLFLVVGGVVALALLGCAGYFLYFKKQQEEQVTEELSTTTELYKKLVNRDPHPGTDRLDNIGAAKAEEKKLQVFLGELKKFFVPSISTTKDLTSREFRALLDNTISEWQHSAERAGVEVTKDYWFTFSPQKSAVTFATNVLGPLKAQLIDIRALCKVLFDAKPVSLASIRRVSAASEDTSAQDFLSTKSVTNEWAILTPYEITFTGFSEQLAAVLEGLIRANNCFVVRNIIVYQSESAPPLETSPFPPMFNPYDRYRMSPFGPQSRGEGDRYRGPQGGQRFTPPPPVAPSPVRTASAGPAGLGEKVLRITLETDSVRLKPAVAAKPTPTNPLPLSK